MSRSESVTGCGKRFVYGHIKRRLCRCKMPLAWCRECIMATVHWSRQERGRWCIMAAGWLQAGNWMSKLHISKGSVHRSHYCVPLRCQQAWNQNRSHNYHCILWRKSVKKENDMLLYRAARAESQADSRIEFSSNFWIYRLTLAAILSRYNPPCNQLFS